MAGRSENNAPNTLTLDGCPDGNSGTYTSDESIDVITIQSVGGGSLKAGDSATITAEVYVYNDSDTAEFWTKTALDSDWQLVGRVTATAGSKQQTLTSPQFPLSSSPLQAVRVQLAYNLPEDNANPCLGLASDQWADRDDLVFSVAA